jgi:hypothetical protein
MQISQGTEEALINDVAKQLYKLASQRDGDAQDVYIDAADALMDVLAMWADDAEATVKV